MQEIAKDPSNTVNQGVFIQRCNEFTTRAAAVYDGLCEYQDNMNYTVQQKVNQMNKYGARIAELNQQILRIEAAQVEKANDLRDERNQLTDELSKLAHINLKEDIDGKKEETEITEWKELNLSRKTELMRLLFYRMKIQDSIPRTGSILQRRMLPGSWIFPVRRCLIWIWRYPQI